MKPSARAAFVEAEATTAIAHQIRILRQQRQWTQHDLARLLKTTQAAVSRLEDPSYGRLSIKTLLDLAHTFDTGLQVKFVSLVEQFRASRKIDRSSMEVEPFSEEAERVAFIEPVVKASLVGTSNVARSLTGIRTYVASSPMRSETLEVVGQ